jgi:ribonuclease HI
LSTTYDLWTDGGAHPNPGGTGGWAYILIAPAGEREVASGFTLRATNNTMEMRALLEGLQSVPDDEPVHVYSDSKYVIDGSRLWAPNWKRKGWRRTNGGQCKNIELWKQILDELDRVGTVTWTHINGHTGVELNEECDRMATEARLSVNG